MKKLLAIDYSTQSTGYAIFDLDTQDLLDYGYFSLGALKIYKGYPFGTLKKLEDMAMQVLDLIQKTDPSMIVVEEVNRGIGRIQQKILAGGHFIMLQKLQGYSSKLFYKDSDGKTGWRTELKHVLAEADKEYNKQIREFNKRVPKSNQKEVLTKKHVTARWVNEKYSKSFDIDKNAHDNDITDAIGLGYSVVRVLTLKKK